MSTSAISRVSAGVPDGGRFAPNGHPEADHDLDDPGAQCGVCGEPSDQDDGIPCSGCLDDHCACGASLDDGEGYDGQCGGCADQTSAADTAAEVAAEHQAETTGHDPVEGSQEWSDGIETCIADEVRRQHPDATSYELMIDDGDEHSYDSLVRVRTAPDGGIRYMDTYRTPAADAIAELASYDDDFGTLNSKSFDMPATGGTDEAATPEPERLHANMGDGPIVTSPSGKYGFYSPVGGFEKADGIAKYGPVVQVAQLVKDGTAWSPTPARFYASGPATVRWWVRRAESSTRRSPTRCPMTMSSCLAWCGCAKDRCFLHRRNGERGLCSPL